MKTETLLWVMLLIPIAASLACAALPRPRAVLGVLCAGVFTATATGAVVIHDVLGTGPVSSATGWLYVDALSAFNLAVMFLIFCLSSAYSWVYFGGPANDVPLTPRQARVFGGLWCGALAAMTLVLVSGNLGIMWVGIEATTLLTAFLICVQRSRAALEATWKYILICSVGVAFAFMGTLLAAASAHQLQLSSHDTLLWTVLRDNAAGLDPVLMKAAFIFLLVGYGTKAGLAPMHTWLPDAYSQAPSPVSALFSGFIVNTALYCIMRYLPITEAATGGTGWCLSLLRLFGLVSIVVGAAFIAFQHDLKRFLAYCSVEHLGIIALGLGLGGLGTFAALFHTLNHSLCKTLSFFAAGRLGQVFGTHDMDKMRGAYRVAPAWGTAVFASILALIGVAPFALFMSEFLIVKAALERGAIAALVIFLAGACVAFVGSLGHALPLAWGNPDGETVREPVRATFLEACLVFLPLATLLCLGLWLPAPLETILCEAADVINGAAAPTLAHFSAGVAP
ncbi:MAG: hypothetical protein A3K19_16905 [Lentisphaerae bacterium RIFOXYB12_FULL_65_16]|nr:MAG: hypothetical protein A3K18_17865 [Lentisphaerae bacterium RIFOXYA12_64_32]OGV88927.1 MAG: hypothetical protein A3K19_16905 [Lentisphaerae bacterium RIFOXYB12_FULL_65_16]